jgi:hypothetical protein
VKQICSSDLIEVIKPHLAACYGLFQERIRKACRIAHDHPGAFRNPNTQWLPAFALRRLDLQGKL